MKIKPEEVKAGMKVYCTCYAVWMKVEKTETYTLKNGKRMWKIHGLGMKKGYKYDTCFDVRETTMVKAA